MSDYIELEDFARAIKYLDEYIEEMSECIEKMARAANDCNDNLGSDEIGRATLDRADNCITKAQQTVYEAKEVRDKLNSKYIEIEQVITKARGY